MIFEPIQLNAEATKTQEIFRGLYQVVAQEIQKYCQPSPAASAAIHYLEISFLYVNNAVATDQVNRDADQPKA